MTGVLALMTTARQRLSTHGLISPLSLTLQHGQPSLVQNTVGDKGGTQSLPLTAFVVGALQMENLI